MSLFDEFKDRFINWGFSDGRKVPVSPSGRMINHLDPANWKSRAEVLDSEYGAAYVFAPGDNLFFLDLDNCVTESGLTAEAAGLWQNFTGGMYEWSQSGKGLHIFGRCRPEMLQDRKHRWDGWKEFYTEGRFVAFGPHGLQPIGDAYRPDIDWTENLRRVVPMREFDSNGVLSTTGRNPEWNGPEDDDELIRRMVASTGGAVGAFGGKATFRDLWEAKWDTLAVFYPSDDDREDGMKADWSRCDAALLSHLAFWTGQDMQRMDRLFRRSSLMRGKWEKRDDYRAKSISDAVAMTRNVYQERRSKPEASAEPKPEQTFSAFLTISEQIEYFAGCVYVRDHHKVFTPDGGLLKPDVFDAEWGGHMFQIDPTNDGYRGTTDSAFKAFTRNRGHRFPMCVGTTWDPNYPTGQIINDRVNTFKPIQVEERDGDPAPFFDFLRRILPNQRDRDIILNYMAATVQHQGVKFQWTPVLQGVEGNGKTMIAEFMCNAVGLAHTHRPDASNITEKYNSFMEGKVLIVIEEIHMSDRRDVLDFLKPLVTNQHIEVRSMGVDKRMIRNFANFIFTTNHRDAIMKSKSDRRFCVFFTAQQSPEDMIDAGFMMPDGETPTDFFPKMYDWARTEGYAIMAKYLREFKIDPELNPAGKCHRAPKTSTTDQAIAASVGRIESEVLDAVDMDLPGFRGGWISSIRLQSLFKDRGVRIGRNKITSMLGGIGYHPCGTLPGGRAKRIVQVEQGRPTLYARSGTMIEAEDPVALYERVQGYLPPDTTTSGNP